MLVTDKFRFPFRQALADKLWKDSKHFYRLAGTTAPWDAAPRAMATCRSWEELKYWSYIVSCYEQHRIYEQMVSDFGSVEALSASGIAAKVKFVGSGSGGSTLNSYRSIVLADPSKPNSWLFEKVYRCQGYDDLERVLAVSRHLGDRLCTGDIFMPRLLDVRKGGELAIVYSAFTPSARVSARQAVARGADVVKELMALPTDSLVSEPVLRKPHSNYLLALAKTRDWIAGRRPEVLTEFDALSRKINDSYPRYLAHGDLHRKNILASGAVLDWDSCGFYPIGYDPGLIIARGLKADSVEELEHSLVKYFGTMNAGTDARLMVSGGLYFALVFGAGKKSALSEPVLESLLAKIVPNSEVEGH
ncbi:Phosphotransferase enzyme family protein [Marinobacter litoralis]|uniref:Phosphotransferase enzyme family protein n=2 Tax=Marinobacter litoralis TaxID=187981 RepID=A0A3M2R906_9GAMM|nr:Phosphotransferase enzyme family protein [Marinobacter litoralis]